MRTLYVGQGFSAADCLISPNNKAFARIEENSTLCVYQGTPDNPQGLLASFGMVAPKKGNYFARLDKDGNFGIYAKSEKSEALQWQTEISVKNKRNKFICLTDDGSFCLYEGESDEDKEKQLLWIGLSSAFQRLMKVVPNATVLALVRGKTYLNLTQSKEKEIVVLRKHIDLITRLIAKGFDSATRIAQCGSVKVFQEQTKNIFAESIFAQRYYKKAQKISSELSLHYLHSSQMLSPSVKGRAFSNSQATFSTMVNYQSLFGSLNYFNANENLSIHSPAAYFFDLMRIINADKTVKVGKKGKRNKLDLKSRRPDLYEIPLDAEATLQKIPYLQVVNYALVKHYLANEKLSVEIAPEEDESALGVGKRSAEEPAPDEIDINPLSYQRVVRASETATFKHICQPNTFPMPPVVLPLEETRIYLNHLGTSLYEMLNSRNSDSVQFNQRELALEYLQLSMVEWEWLNKKELPENLKKIPQEMETTAFYVLTGMNPSQLKDLIPFETELTKKNSKYYKGLYINQCDNEKDDEKDRSKPIIFTLDFNTRSEKINHLTPARVRYLLNFTFLAKKLALSNTDLQTILAAAHIKEIISEDHIKTIATIRWLSQDSKLPLSTVVACFGGVGHSFDAMINRAELLSHRGEKDKIYQPDDKDLLEEIQNALSILQTGGEIGQKAVKVIHRLCSALELEHYELVLLCNVPTRFKTNFDLVNWLYRAKNISRLCGDTIVNVIKLNALVNGADADSMIEGQQLNQNMISFFYSSMADEGQLNHRIMSLYAASVSIKQYNFPTDQVYYIVAGPLPTHEHTQLREKANAFLHELQSSVKSYQQAHPSLADLIRQEIAAHFIKDLKMELNSELIGEVLKRFSDEEMNALATIKQTDHNAFTKTLENRFNQELEQITAVAASKSEDTKQVQQEFKLVKLTELMTTSLVKKLRNISVSYQHEISPLDQFVCQKIATYLNLEVSIISTFLKKTHGQDPNSRQPITTYISNAETFLEIHKIVLLIKGLNLTKQGDNTDSNESCYDDISLLARCINQNKQRKKFITFKDIQFFIQLKKLQKAFNDRENQFLKYYRSKQEFLSLRQWDENTFDKITACLSSQKKAKEKEKEENVFDQEDLKRLLLLECLFSLLTKLNNNVAIWVLFDINKMTRIDSSSVYEYYDHLCGLLEKLPEIQAAINNTQEISVVVQKREELKRNALLQRVYRQLQGKYPEKITKLSDISQYLLLDVEMTGVYSTSLISEGIHSLQLYLQRCHLNVEQDVKLGIPEKWWPWLENYRIWEANRKVLLYPENYIEPDLRIEQSPEFTQLTRMLSQANLDKPDIEAAFKQFFHKLSVLNNLVYCEACATKQKDDNDETIDVIYLFAHTQNYPYEYYVRSLTFSNGDLEHLDWSYWNKIDVGIQSGLITPLYTLNRLFIFWVEPRFEQRKNTVVKTGDKEYSNQLDFKILCTFQNSDGSWASPQALHQDKCEIDEADVWDDFTILFVRNRHELNQRITEQKSKHRPHDILLICLLDNLINNNYQWKAYLMNESHDFEECSEISIKADASMVQEIEAIKKEMDAAVDNNGIRKHQKNIKIRDYDRQHLEDTILGAIPRHRQKVRPLEAIHTNGVLQLRHRDEAEITNYRLYSLNQDLNKVAIEFDENKPSEIYINYYRIRLAIDHQMLLLTEVSERKYSSLPHEYNSQFLLTQPAKNDQFCLVGAGLLVGRKTFALHPCEETHGLSDLFYIKYLMTTAYTDKIPVAHTEDIHVSPHLLKSQGLATSAKSSTTLQQVLLLNERTRTYLLYAFNDQNTILAHQISSLDAFNRLTRALFAGGIPALYQRKPAQNRLKIAARKKLAEGSTWKVPGSTVFAQLEKDGRFCIYLDKDQQKKSQPIFSTPKQNNKEGKYTAVLEYDGNFIISWSPKQKKESRIVFQTNTRLHDADNTCFALLDNNGHFTIYESKKAEHSPIKRVWSSSSKVILLNEEQSVFESSNGLYFWELFFHTPFLIANRLHAQRRYEEARNWYHYIFNPYAEKEKFKFPPFQNIRLTCDSLTDQKIVDIYHNHAFDPHLIAALRPLAYMKAIVMKYIQNLMDWADALFSEDTRETITLAINLYMMAQDLLGDKPEKLGSKVQATKVINFNHYLEGKVEYSNITENILKNLENQIQNYTIASTLALNEFNPYFSIPENKEFMAYWDRIADRLFKIRHSLSIQGLRQELDLFSPEIDPHQLIRAAASTDGNIIKSLLPVTIPYYRFSVMLEYAKSFTHQVIQLSSTLLAALERQSSEELAKLSNQHQTTTLELIRSIKQQQVDQTHYALLQARASLNAMEERKTYYAKLLKEGLSKEEKEAKGLKIAAQVAYGICKVATMAGGFASAFPQFTTGFIGVEPVFMEETGGMQVGNAIQVTASVAGLAGDALGFASEDLTIEAGYRRREQEWRQQQQQAEHDIQIMQHQVKANEIQLEIAKAEYENQVQMDKQQLEIEQYYRTKFTNHDLYIWMADQLVTFYRQAYDLAFSTARSAECAYQYEINNDSSEKSLLSNNHYSFFRKGLLAGESLMLELNRMEKAYLDNNKRRLEIEKTISLKQLIIGQLKEKEEEEEKETKEQKGKKDPQDWSSKLRGREGLPFELEEKYFEDDFSDHMNRRIKRIYITIPSLTKPYQNFNLVLTQTSHKKSNNDTFFRRPTSGEQIILSSGVNDAGLFEASFQEGRYLPFEGTSVISSWNLRLGNAKNAEIVNSINDIIFHLQYTAEVNLKSQLGAST